MAALLIGKCQVRARLSKPDPDAKCHVCNVPRCTAACPKRPFKSTVAKALLVASLVTLDAAADPSNAVPMPDLVCHSSSVYHLFD